MLIKFYQFRSLKSFLIYGSLVIALVTESLPSHNMCIGTVPSVSRMKPLQTIIADILHSLAQRKASSGLCQLSCVDGFLSLDDITLKFRELYL